MLGWTSLKNTPWPQTFRKPISLGWVDVWKRPEASNCGNICRKLLDNPLVTVVPAWDLIWQPGNFGWFFAPWGDGRVTENHHNGGFVVKESLQNGLEDNFSWPECSFYIYIYIYILYLCIYFYSYRGCPSPSTVSTRIVAFSVGIRAWEGNLPNSLHVYTIHWSIYIRWLHLCDVYIISPYPTLDMLQNSISFFTRTASS